MTRNMGSTDKLVRLVVALTIAVLYYLNVLSGMSAIILGLIAIILSLTSLLNFCPIYKILGINTCSVNKK